MTAIAFDTLKVVEQLERAGVPLEQAKAQANVLAEVMGSDHFATQHDFTQELTGIRADINSLRMEMRTLNSDTKAELVRWVVAVGVLQMALIAGLVLKLVP